MSNLIFPTLITPATLEMIDGWRGFDSLGNTEVRVEASFGADLSVLREMNDAQILEFAQDCVELTNAWLCGAAHCRPVAVVSGPCLGGSLEAVLAAASEIHLLPGACLQFPEELALDIRNQPVSWPFCGGREMAKLWGFGPALTQGTAPLSIEDLLLERPDDLFFGPVPNNAARLWAASIKRAENLAVLARAQRMAINQTKRS